MIPTRGDMGNTPCVPLVSFPLNPQGLVMNPNFPYTVVARISFHVITVGVNTHDEADAAIKAIRNMANEFVMMNPLIEIHHDEGVWCCIAEPVTDTN